MRSAVRPRTPSRVKPGVPGFAKSSGLALAGLVLLALVARLIFIGAEGYSNDVGTFESWSLTLAQHPLRDFYASAGFADYPPGYFFVLWIVGHVYKLLVHTDPSYGILKIFVKMPSILTDLACTVLLFAIVRRFATLPWAFASAALFALNPATIYISAYWGQVDSVAAAVVLGMVYTVVSIDDKRGKAVVLGLAVAWLLLAYSILIKPPASLLVPLLLAYPFAAKDAAQRQSRLLGAALGIVLALILTYLSALAFHAGWNPIDQFRWLFDRYHFASNVYPYNSINAFNIYTVRFQFWQPDSAAVFTIGGFALPQFALGITLVVVSAIFIVVRYLQRRTLQSFLEAALLLSLALFILATRMHERYIFNAMVFCFALIFAGRRYLVASILLSITLFANLVYSLFYLHVVGGTVTGYDARDMFPWITHPLSILNVLIFFYLAYQYMDPDAETVLGRFENRLHLPKGRHWFPPLEGTVQMTRLDWLLAPLFVFASFLLTFWKFWLPSEKVFDEIYYARAAEEYLQHKEIFEFTHPPLTKLVITLSTLLFGGLNGGLGHGGDTGFGWRFLNLVVAALMVGVIYLFAKRLLGSTLFASIAAGFLLLDGFHFAQARIATPEITVAFFSLTTLYTFYRFWLASRVRVAPLLTRALSLPLGLSLVLGTLVAFGASRLLIGLTHDTSSLTPWIAFAYFELGVYVFVRLAVPRLRPAPSLVSYADGAKVIAQKLLAPDGGSVDLSRRLVVAGDVSRGEQGALRLADEELRVEYTASGEEHYVTPDGEAEFTADGTMSAGGYVTRGTDATLWLWLLSISAGLLAASKWNGLFDFFVVWLLVAVVVSQPYFVPLLRMLGLPAKRLPAVWGNPFGFSLDIVVAAMLFVGLSIYTLTYIPYFALNHNVGDLIALQKQMYFYHHDLHATHPYSSQWWQWPLLQIPISYYYQDSRHGAASSNAAACCLTEILALPNPLLWWTGLISVPLLAWWGWVERNKGYALLVTAYILQWLPWILSPRIAFEYHFFPNLAIILLADAVLMQRIWQWKTNDRIGKVPLPKALVSAYVLAAFVAFVFWFPVVAGTPLTWNDWNARMLTGLEGNNWINPHPGQ